MSAANALPGYSRFEYAAAGIVHWVHHRGPVNAPPLLLLPELPGIAPGLLQMAVRLEAAGYHVYIAQLFGGTGRRTPLRNALRLCVAREFSRLRAGVNAPVTGWLQGLAQALSRRHSGARVGVIGMCVTAGFALPTVLVPQVGAVVAAQPAVPLALRHLLSGRDDSPGAADVTVSGPQLQAIAERLAHGECAALAVRCRADRLCPPQRLARLQQALGPPLQVREYGGADDRNAAGQRRHATYTKEYRLAPDAGPDHPSRQAWADLLEFLARHLRDGAPPPT